MHLGSLVKIGKLNCNYYTKVNSFIRSLDSNTKNKQDNNRIKCMLEFFTWNFFKWDASIFWVQHWQRAWPVLIWIRKWITFEYFALQTQETALDPAFDFVHNKCSLFDWARIWEQEIVVKIKNFKIGRSWGNKPIRNYGQASVVYVYQPKTDQ